MQRQPGGFSLQLFPAEDGERKGLKPNAGEAR